MARPIRPNEIRTWRGTSYGWVDHRLRPWLRHMSPDESAVYLFLVLAADRSGVSWYAHASIGTFTGLGASHARLACEGLQQLGLVAYRPHRPDDCDGVFQVLPVPAAPRPATREARDGGAQPLADLLRQFSPQGPAR